MLVAGSSGFRRLASFAAPDGVVGCTLTVPHPAAASAASASAGHKAARRTLGSLSGDMRRTKVEDHSSVLVYGALGGPLPRLGVIAAAALAALVILHRDTRVQALATLGALILAPVLLLADIWHSPQLGIVHRHPLVAV